MVKLIKFEFIHSLRTYFIGFGVFLLACFVEPILINITNDGLTAFVYLILGGWLVYMGILVMLVISIFKNYYDSMFRHPGYLTLTLPVSTTSLILSKILVTMIWLLMSFIVFIVGVCIFAITLNYGGIPLLDLLYDLAREIWTSFSNWIQIFHIFIRDVLLALSLLFYMISGVYFFLTFTHTKLIRSHRVLVSVVSYVLFNVIFGTFMDGLYYGNNIETILSIVIFTALGVIFVVGTIYILDHHIELD